MVIVWMMGMDGVVCVSFIFFLLVSFLSSVTFLCCIRYIYLVWYFEMIQKRILFKFAHFKQII